MKIAITTLFILSFYCMPAQPGTAKEVKPRFSIELTTIQGNVLKGLLLQVNDTSIIVYPGKRKEWNKKEEYYPVLFGFSNIGEIKLKKNNGIVKGMTLGGGAGLSAMLATVILNNTTAKSGQVNNAVLIVPAGIIGGAYIGSTNRKNFNINGNETAFIEFKKLIK